MAVRRSLAGWSMAIAVACAPRMAVADGAAGGTEAAVAALRTLAPGERVRVQLEGERAVGRFRGATLKQLRLEAGKIREIRIAALRGIERSRYRSRTMEGLRWGFVAGAAVGAVGMVMVAGLDVEASEATPLLGAGATTVLGALVGLAVGVALSGEAWEPVARW